MNLKLLYSEVGPWPMNTYIVVNEEEHECVIIDPGADAEKILALCSGYTVLKILITHGHPDHIGAINIVNAIGNIPVYIHPEDGTNFKINYDFPLKDSDVIDIGKKDIKAVHTPGHTAGMMSFLIGDHRAVVGDTIFVGGPGKTWSAQNFETTMHTMQEIVFKWPDETIFYPGHGPYGTIGEERPAFEEFIKRGWAPDLFGDVTWS